MTEKDSGLSWSFVGAMLLGVASTTLVATAVITVLKVFFGYNDLPENTQVLLWLVVWGWSCFLTKDFWWTVFGWRN